jgi:hypothetical protein
MEPWWKRIRYNRIFYIVAGGIVLYLSFGFDWDPFPYYVPISTRLLAGIGGAALTYGVITFIRRKGDYDDFQDLVKYPQEEGPQKRNSGRSE